MVVEILLVEDDPNDVELTLRALRSERLGNQVHVARDGEEAIAFCAERKGTGELPRLILLDLKLPKVDGHEVLRYLKGDPELKVVPVVVLTSSKQDEDMYRCYLTGVNSYIQKPVNFDSFRKLVKDLGWYWLVVNQLPSQASREIRK